MINRTDLRRSPQLQDIKDLEGSSKDPTFKIPGTTQNLYIVDSCIICVKKSWLAITTLDAKQLYSSVNVVTLKLKCN